MGSRAGWLVLALAICVGACGDTYQYRTREYMANSACGQGPYDVLVPADGTTAEDGVEVIACTPRRLAGQVLVQVGFPMRSSFGSDADNQRCVASQPVVVVAGAGAGAVAASSSGAVGAAGSAGLANAPALVEQPYRGGETGFADELCKPFGLPAQVIADEAMDHYAKEDWPVAPGEDMRVRIWSDVPNDLSGVIFLVRQVRASAKQKPRPVEHESPKPASVASAQAPPAPAPKPAAAAPHPSYSPPPPPLAEEQPPRTSDTAAWVPGYWTWTGTAWGWIAGSWRDASASAAPAPQAEQPGAPPVVGAIWIGGSWRRSGATWVWITGRWRR